MFQSGAIVTENHFRDFFSSCSLQPFNGLCRVILRFLGIRHNYLLCFFLTLDIFQLRLFIQAPGDGNFDPINNFNIHIL